MLLCVSAPSICSGRQNKTLPPDMAAGPHPENSPAEQDVWIPTLCTGVHTHTHTHTHTEYTHSTHISLKLSYNGVSRAHTHTQTHTHTHTPTHTHTHTHIPTYT